VSSAGILVEACVDSVESAMAAEQGGAGRIELCDNLVDGGTTPSAATIEACRERLRIPIHVLVRPRGGDFLYSDLELEVMLRDVEWAKRLGADGVVIGALRVDGTVDAERTGQMLTAARPMSLTFHRAFDVCRDADEALDTLISLGVNRVLTSGQAPSALEGASLIAAMVRRAAGRIGVLAGGGLDETNVARLVRETGVREVHVRGTSAVRSDMAFRRPEVRMGGAAPAGEYEREVTDEARVREITGAISGLGREAGS
jgi:copper homeostasis protein